MDENKVDEQSGARHIYSMCCRVGVPVVPEISIMMIFFEAISDVHLRSANNVALWLQDGG